MLNEAILIEKLKNYKLAIESRDEEIRRLNLLLATKDSEIKKLKPQQEIIKNNKEEKLINYKFAKASKETAQKFEQFIRKCVSHEAKKPFIVMPETAMLYKDVDVSVKTKDNFMKILMNTSLDGVKLVFKSNGRYFANFNADDICNYLLKEID